MPKTAGCRLSTIKAMLPRRGVRRENSHAINRPCACKGFLYEIAIISKGGATP